MKKQLMMAAALMAATISFSSCSLLSGKEETKKEAVLPQDREQIQKQASLKTYTPKEFSKGVIKGDWSIEEVAGKKAVGETAPFLKFDEKSKRMYGNNGCNTINALYKYNPKDSTISFSETITTLKACGLTGITDYEINNALDHTHHYSLRQEDNAYWLYFYSSTGELLMTMMHQNFEFLNGTWKVVSIDDTPVDVPDMKLVIDVDEGKIHGNSGCNIFNGSFTIDMDSANSISFQAIGITRMACPEPNYETRLLVALEAASRAKPVSPTKVLLLDDQGKVVLTLIRTTDN